LHTTTLRTTRRLIGAICLLVLALPAQAQQEAIAPFERMIDGEWILGSLLNGTVQHDQWRWGPGKHSIIGYTRNTKDFGQSTSGIYRMIYWHPTQQRLKLLAIARGGLTSDGDVTLDDNSDVHFDLTLYYSDETSKAYQVDPVRHLQYGWFFEDDNSYHARWYEDRSGQREILSGWHYTRHERDNTIHDEPLKPLTHFKLVETMLGDYNAGDATLTLTRIPHAHALRLQTSSPDESTEGVLYFHEGTDRIQYLGLRSTGEVDEGTVTLTDNGAIRIHLDEADTSITLKPEADDALSWQTTAPQRPSPTIYHRVRDN